MDPFWVLRNSGSKSEIQLAGAHWSEWSFPSRIILEYLCWSDTRMIRFIRSRCRFILTAGVDWEDDSGVWFSWNSRVSADSFRLMPGTIVFGTSFSSISEFSRGYL